MTLVPLVIKTSTRFLSGSQNVTCVQLESISRFETDEMPLVVTLTITKGFHWLRTSSSQLLRPLLARAIQVPTIVCCVIIRRLTHKNSAIPRNKTGFSLYFWVSRTGGNGFIVSW